MQAISLTPSTLSGTYHIVAPKLSDGWDDANQGDLALSLSPSTGGSHLWGSFSFGVFSGFHRSTSKIPSKTGVSVKFLWRGSENGEGEMSNDKTNTGTLTFLPDGRLTGEVYWDCLGKFDLFGRKVGDVRAAETGEWKRSYYEINEASYARAGVSRWVGWGGDASRDRKEKNSDTESEGGEDSEGERSESDEGNGLLWSVPRSLWRELC